MGIGVIAAVALLLMAFTSGFFEPAVGRAVTSEGGVGQHIPDGAKLPQRNRPPSSGPHYATPAAYGLSVTPIPAGNWVHSLEHGGITILYRCQGDAECASIGQQLQDQIYSKARPGRFGAVKIVITPYQDMDSPMVAVAWEHELDLQSIDAAQILAFYNRFVDRGPENVP